MYNVRLLLAWLLLLGLLVGCGPQLPEFTEQGEPFFRINQVGYYPGSINDVVLTRRPSDATLYLTDGGGEKILAKSTISLDSLRWDLAGETVWLAAFTAPRAAGTYRLYANGVGFSYPFAVGPQVLQLALEASIKGLYFQRASTELPSQFAGQWQRAAGHPDTAVFYHPSTGIISGQHASPGAGTMQVITTNTSLTLLFL
ncbi:MAG: hypothetical protein HC821_02690 [Lewinella sp.]|nr:hypothetical protein [Lewinella sp.]